MPNVNSAWEQAKLRLKEQLGEPVFSTWILPLVGGSQNDSTITLEAPDAFFKDWVEKNYRQAIEEALAGYTKTPVSLLLKTGVASQKPVEPALPQAKIAAPPGISNLNSRYSFENFVVGTSNRHAHAYSLAVAESPAKTYNPLFIYGGVGLGKTHLIQAVCHHINIKSAGAAKICYLPAERFTNELIEAIQRGSTSSFRQKYRNLDVLVIDDVHFFGGKDSSQEEFFHTFNSLYDAHKQILLSSDRPPKEIADLQERLVNRFGWGLAVEIQPPDLETRVAILKKKVEREPVHVPDEVIFFIAQLIKTNIRDLEGALIKTIAHSLLEEKPISVELTKEVLKELIRAPKKLITVDFIQRCVAEEFGLTIQELKTKRRNKAVVVPRQVAMYLSRELTDLSLPEIGGSFGGKDHTTVLHSYNKIKGVLSKDESMKSRVEKVIHVIKQ